jgi:hypothetical protein
VIALIRTGSPTTVALYACSRDSGEGRNRTGDTTVFSRVLYQLSYLAAVAQCSGAP